MTLSTAAPTTTDDEYPDDPYLAQMSADEQADYDAFLAREQARGPLACCPDTMPCWECGGFNGVDSVEQTVVALGRPTRGFDPSETYVLACGHKAMA